MRGENTTLSAGRPPCDDERLLRRIEILESMNAALSRSLEGLSHDLQMLLLASGDGLLVIRDGLIVDANPAAARLLGTHDRRALIGLRLTNVAHPEHIERVRMACRRALKQDSIHSVQTIAIFRFDGSMIDLEGFFRPIAWKGEDAVLFLFREAKPALEDSEQGAGGDWRELVDLANSAIIRWRPDGEIIFFNDYAKRFFGYSAEEIIGKKVTILTPKRDPLRNEPRALASNLLASQDGYLRDVDENVRKDGQRVWVAWTNKPILDEKGRVVEILAVGNDVTDQKLSEMALRAARDELDQKIQERTAKLASINEELQKEIAEKRRLEQTLRERAAELKRSNEDLEQFAYVASHQLQQPLRNVANCVKLLKMKFGERLGRDSAELMGHLQDSTDRLRTFVSDILEYARAQATSQPFRPVDSNRILQASLFNLRALIEESGAKILYTDLPTVYADGSQLEQVFQNLIVNAIKFRGNDLPTVFVSAQIIGDECVFSVADNGIGVSRDRRERIFDPFVRSQDGSGRPGLGLGLNVARKIVKRHNGGIWMEPRPGAGSTFYFSIPHKGPEEAGEEN